MATHSSVLAWRIAGTGKPGGLPSMGLHRVGHNWSDLLLCNMISKLSDLKHQHFIIPPDSVGWVGGLAHFNEVHSGIAFSWWLDWRQRAWDTSLPLLGTWYLLSARPLFPFSCLEWVHLLTAEAFQEGRGRCGKVSWAHTVMSHNVTFTKFYCKLKRPAQIQGWEKRPHLSGLPWQSSG